MNRSHVYRTPQRKSSDSFGTHIQPFIGAFIVIAVAPFVFLRGRKEEKPLV